MAENGENGNNGNKGGGGNGDDKGVDVKALNESLKGLPTQIRDAVESAVVTAIGTARDDAEEARRGEQDPDDDGDKGPDDVETLNNKELIDHIVAKVDKSVSKALTGLGERITGVQSTTEEDRIRTEAVAIAKRDPLFMQMREEMAEVAKKHPDLSVRDIFNLAKIHNPEKVKKLAEASKEEEEEKRKKAGEVPEAFGGLLPNSGVRPSEGDGKMSPKDAANKAFDDVMKDVPAHILSGETS